MKPAFSVIFLTTLIGAGQGLFLAYYSADLLHLLAIIDVELVHGSMRASILSLVLLVAGLVASFFHLGHPERAWRAAAMWRTSWLSREVIALPAAMGSIFFYAVLLYSENATPIFTLATGEVFDVSMLVGLLALIAVLGLYICTAMIYTCLKFLQQWHSPLTVVNFFLMGLASGFTLATLVSTHYDPALTGYFSTGAVIFTLLALVFRFVSVQRNRNLKSKSTLQSAIGVHHPNIRQLAQGAMGGSFNTRAFIHTYGASVVILARRFFFLSAFVIPAILLMFGALDSVWIVSLAVILQLSGLLVERWYFFIEANHPQNVYYQMIS